MSVGDIKQVHVAFGLDQMNLAGDLSDRAFDFRVAGMPDEDQRPPLRDIALSLVVNLGDQGTRCVENRQAARGCLIYHRLGDTMRAEDCHRIRRNLGNLLDEASTFRLQVIHDTPVMHDFMAHIDRCLVFFECSLDDLDGANDAGTKSTRLSKNNTHLQKSMSWA